MCYAVFYGICLGKFMIAHKSNNRFIYSSSYAVTIMITENKVV